MNTQLLIMKGVERICIGLIESFITPFAWIYQRILQEDIKLAAFQEDI
jgi:hypothetical protein